MSAKTILVVEDEPDIRNSLRDAFEDEGFRVVVAANGREALDLVGRLARPLVVVLDIIMPIMSGDEVYAAMKRDPALADIPVLVSTSDPARAPAGVSLLRKPIDLDDLIETVRKLF